jgi:WD40 repeat protein
LYNSSGWELQARVQLQTMDAADIAWSPDSSKLAVWDSPLTYAVHVLGPDGASLGSYSAYGDGLGVRSVSWSPGGDLLAVGSYDQVRGGLRLCLLLRAVYSLQWNRPCDARVWC